MKKFWTLILSLTCLFVLLICGCTPDEPVTYNVTIIENIDEAGDTTGTGDYEKDGSVTVTATTNNGYTFVGWYDGETKVCENPTYVFAAVEDRTLTAKWTKNSYTLTATSADDDKGTVTGGGVYEYGTSVTLTATPKTGYAFQGWYISGEFVGDDTTLTFSLTGDTTVEGRWSPIRYTLTVTATPDGAGSVSGGGEYDYNTSATLTATTSNGYTFDGWYDGETKIASTATYAYVVTGNKTLTAKWVRSVCTVSLSKNVASAGTIAGADEYAYGTSVTVTATTNSGYTFDGWYLGSERVSTQTEYTFTLTQDVALTAKWLTDKVEYTISTTKNIDVAGSVSGGGVIAEGESVTLTATANEGYTFDGWYDGENKISVSETYTFVVSADKSLIAKWTLNSYTVALNKNIEGAGILSGAGTYDHNETATIAVLTNAGYEFNGWYDGETKVSEETKYVFAVTANKTLTAKWTRITYAIAVSSEDESVGTVTGGGTYDYGATVTLTATGTVAGYTFDGWYDGENKISASATYTFTALENKTLTAKWAKDTYAISVTLSDDRAGTVTGAGNYEYGDSVTLRATTNLHFEFLGWYEGTHQISADSTYTFTVTGSRTITAKWRLKDNSNPNGGWTGIV